MLCRPKLSYQQRIQYPINKLQNADVSSNRRDTSHDDDDDDDDDHDHQHNRRRRRRRHSTHLPTEIQFVILPGT